MGVNSRRTNGVVVGKPPLTEERREPRCSSTSEMSHPPQEPKNRPDCGQTQGLGRPRSSAEGHTHLRQFKQKRV